MFTELKNKQKFVSLIQGSFSLVHIQSVRSGLVVIDKELLEHFNHDCYELSKKEIVYLMLEAKEDSVRNMDYLSCMNQIKILKIY